MYESFYGLKEKPFTLLPDPDYLYLSPKHQRALTLLEYGMMNQAGFSVICGDTGAGKTTLIRRLLTELGDDTRVGLITNTHHSFGELLNWVLMAFGLDGDGKNKAQMHQMFIEFLIEQYALNKHMVLIVDEAQNMSADTLEELRMLSNINADKDQVLQVILAGQPALRETLRKPELMQFAQRIAVDYYLESLSGEETESYIHHRLKVAGAEKPVFTNEACKAIYKYSRGTPRLINLLCDTSMVYGFAEQSETISEQLVHDVVREQHSNSIIPTFNTDEIDNETSQKQPNKTPVEKAIEKKSIQEKEVSAAIEPAVQKIEKVNVVAKQTQQASVANGLEKAVTVGRVEPKPDIEKTINRSASAERTKEKLEEVKNDTNVTPIKTKPPSVAPVVDEAKIKKNNPPEKKKTAAPDIQENETEKKVSQQQVSISNAESATGANETKVSLPKIDDEDIFPIVHIEENPKKGFSMILLGLVIGMFIASIAMMVVAWMLLGNKDNNQQQINQQSINQQSTREAESREINVLQKERDAALAVSRALELERDAAIKSAEAQEKMRAAEMRAAEILAKQEREAEKKLQQAKIRIKEAERAEARARARERKAKLQVEKKTAEIESQRVNALRNERKRLEAIAAKERLAEQRRLQRQLTEQKAVAERAAAQPKAKEQPPKKGKESFSSNPCNSPSAKFLSTCKK